MVMLTTRQVEGVPKEKSCLQSWLQSVENYSPGGRPIPQHKVHDTRGSRKRRLQELDNEAMPPKKVAVGPSNRRVQEITKISKVATKPPGSFCPSPESTSTSSADRVGRSPEPKAVVAVRRPGDASRADAAEDERVNGSIRSVSVSKALLDASILYLQNHLGYRINFYRLDANDAEHVPLTEPAHSALKQLNTVLRESVHNVRMLETIRLPTDPPASIHQAWLSHASPQMRNDIELQVRELKFWEEFQNISCLAKSAHYTDAPEPTWNADVQTRLFNLAFEEAGHVGLVKAINATVLRIADKADSPGAVNLSGISVDEAMPIAKSLPTSKMVDFLVLISGDNSFKAKVRAYLNKISKNGINHTEINGDDDNKLPIGISIETKRSEDAASLRKAKDQLTIWLMAQYKNMRRQFGNDIDLPPLPVIIVYGHVWRFYIVELDDTRMLQFWHSDDVLLSTSSPEGLFKIIKALRFLRDWSHAVLKEWWIERIDEYMASSFGETQAKMPKSNFLPTPSGSADS